MKMGLSVVMGVLDKVTAPLKSMTSNSDLYAKKIKKVQQAQANDSAALVLIDSYKNITNAAQNNALNLDAAKEKLQALQAKESQAAKKREEDNNKLNRQLEQQAERLNKLNARASRSGTVNDALTQKIAAQTAKFEELKAKIEAVNRPNAARARQLAQQSSLVSRLAVDSDRYGNSLRDLSEEMQRAGVDSGRLDDETERLTRSQNANTESIERMTRHYGYLQRAMAIPQRLGGLIKMPTLDTVKGGAMAGGAALGSFVGFGVIIADAAERVNELSRAAKDISMPVEELQAMRLQAKSAGAEAEDMDAALREMSLRWGEMKTLKSGAMNDYFVDTGNKRAYKDLQNAKDATEAYQILLREIAAEKDVAKQNFMADEFFGGDSEKMLAVLKSGVDGLEKAKQQLNDTGGPITGESVQAASKFSSTLKTLSAIVESLKISALTPIMAELSIVFTDLIKKMKDMDWREQAISQLRVAVGRVFEAFKALGNGIIFLSENFKTIIAALAIFKVAMIAINAVIMANPIGLMVAAIGAAVIGITYLIDKFIGIGAALDWLRGATESVLGWLNGALETVSNSIGNMGEKFESLIRMLPDSLIPDSWQDSLSATGDDIDNVASKIRKISDKNAHVGVNVSDYGVDSLTGKLNAISDKNAMIGITTNENINQSVVSTRSELGGESVISPTSKIAPLTTQSVKSQAEIAVTIKSEAPVTVDKVGSDKHTNLSVDVGSMMLSY